MSTYNDNENECEITLVYLTREDGQIAKVSLPVYEGEDLWTAIGNEYPKAYDHMDESNVLSLDGADYEWGASFVPTEDEGLRQWLLQEVA